MVARCAAAGIWGFYEKMERRGSAPHKYFTLAYATHTSHCLVATNVPFTAFGKGMAARCAGSH
jgi:hypothetical protein